MAKYEVKDGVGIIPEGTTFIDNQAFNGCTRLTSVIIPDSVTEIGKNAFCGCTGLTSITIPDSVTEIGPSAFWGCTGLTSITIPDSVKEIGDSAFWGCTGLKSVTIPDSVTEIGEIYGSAFKGCTGLTQIKVSKGNKNYDSRDNCNAIIQTTSNSLIAGCSSTTIPDSVTEIGSSAFEGCTGLTGIIIPDSVKKIGNDAFCGCTGLTEIIIPNSVASIGSSALYNCSGLISIVVDSGNTTYDSRNNCNAIIETATNKIMRGCKNTVIPDSVTEIGPSAFKGCTGLTEITIPDSVTEIGRSAFCDCKGLTKIIIPNSVTSIGDYAFYGCSGLMKIIIPDSVTEIGRSAFCDCTGLTSIAIPDSVKKIGNDAFCGCTGLTKIEISKGNETYDSRNDCNAIIETSTNELKLGCQNTVIPDSVKKIRSDAFRGCTGLTTIVIPDSVTWIGEGAFSGCSGLKSVTIGTDVRRIENNVFNSCDSLKQIILRITNPSQITTERGVELGGHQATVYVPNKKSVTAYKNKAIWKKFAAIEFLDMKDDTFLEKEAKLMVSLDGVGIKEPIHLLPTPSYFEAENVLTVTYNINESKLPFTAKLEVQATSDGQLYMLVDGQPIKKLKKEVIFKTPGQHIIRILSYYRSFEEFFVYASTGFPDKFPGSELIRLPDSMTGFDSDDRRPIAGAKKLLLGAGYNDNIPSSLNFDVIDVVPENPYLEMKNDCLIKKETKELMYVSSKATEIPNDVKKISSGSLKKCSFRTIRIPKSVENFTYSFDKNSKIKEIIFEEGLLTASIYNFNSKPLSLSKVDNPSSLDYLYMYGVEMDSLIVPANVRIVQFSNCKIKRLEIKGDIFDCNYDRQHCFRDFVGEIFLSGSVRPYEEFVPGVHGSKKSIGTMKDGCVIHVKDESVAQTIRDCTDFNPNVKIVIDMNK